MNRCLAPTVSGRYLSLVGREVIALWRVHGQGVREFARSLERSASTFPGNCVATPPHTYRRECKASTV
ncbi:helix-turn-helix domain-containing protein [Kocuria carniphila]|uniref:helix-turn-helix domain-containing protein n=1 Tax=Kocuria carniphila TaxID=262208 RepID=UPI0039083B92